MPEIQTSSHSEGSSQLASPNLESQVSSLTSLVKQLVSNQEVTLSQFNNLKETVNSKFSEYSSLPSYKKEEPKVEDDSWWEGFDPDVRDTVKKEVGYNISQIEKKIDEKLSKKEQEQADREKRRDLQKKYDTIAAQKYPQLEDPNHPLYSEFNKVWAEKLQLDPKWKDNPSAILDSAHIAYANLVNKGEIIPEQFKDEALRLIGVSDSQLLPIKQRIPEKETELNDSQRFWADNLKIPHDRYLKRLRQGVSGRVS